LTIECPKRCSSSHQARQPAQSSRLRSSAI